MRNIIVIQVAYSHVIDDIIVEWNLLKQLENETSSLFYFLIIEQSLKIKERSN